MTEAEWLACEDPKPMLSFIQGTRSVRKARLFACAAAQGLRSDGGVGAMDADIQALQVVADTGVLDPDLCQDELSEITSPMVGTVYFQPEPNATPFVMVGSLIFPRTTLCLIEAMKLFNEIFSQECGVVFDIVPNNGTVVEYDSPVFRVIPAPTRHFWKGVCVAGYLRDVMGNPFHPVAFSPAWRTDTAVSLARTMYDARDFSAMPILADALQDAGCDNDDVLNHCRGPGPHIRGCWVVDLVLEKE